MPTSSIVRFLDESSREHSSLRAITPVSWIILVESVVMADVFAVALRGLPLFRPLLLLSRRRVRSRSTALSSVLFRDAWFGGAAKSEALRRYELAEVAVIFPTRASSSKMKSLTSASESVSESESESQLPHPPSSDFLLFFSIALRLAGKSGVALDLERADGRLWAAHFDTTGYFSD